MALTWSQNSSKLFASSAATKARAVCSKGSGSILQKESEIKVWLFVC